MNTFTTAITSKVTISNDSGSRIIKKKEDEEQEIYHKTECGTLLCTR